MSPLSETPRLLIVGASARAAAYSAVRAGFEPFAVDLFGDRDLRAIATCVTVEDWQRPPIAAIDALPPGPWLYTGALENRPGLVETLSSRRPLWGVPPAVLERVRDPRSLQDVLRSADLPVPEIRSAESPPPADGEWMLKPRRSAGGRGIAVWSEECREHATLREPHWFQQRIRGRACSALFLGSSSRVEMIGTTRQLVGRRTFGAPSYAYCGSIGPIDLSASSRRTLARLGETVGGSFGLRGLFGIDLIRSSDGRWWPLEVNPRYTASTEVLELGFERPLLRAHAAACGAEDATGWLLGSLPSRRRIVAKGIVYATRAVTVPELPWRATSDACDVPHLADVPAAGTVVAAGRPVCTVFANGPDGAACRRGLVAAVRRMRAWLGSS